MTIIQRIRIPECMITLKGQDGPLQKVLANALTKYKRIKSPFCNTPDPYKNSFRQESPMPKKTSGERLLGHL